jgi:glycosyltransferase involved in cell wall biosynthesis
MSVAACTIVANNYLPAAAVFARSYREHHPDAEVFVCVVDRPAGDVRYDELPFRVVFADDLGIGAFHNLAFRYRLLELSTAVKPFLLEHLHRRHAVDRLFYFDPDIWVLDALDDLAEELERAQLVLTPHLLEPLDDHHSPSERAIRLCGVYNLGFLGVRFDDATRSFLHWWQDRLRLFCLAEPRDGLFVDQSWMEYAPAFLDRVAIQRDPRHNVAYWNLGQRRVERRGDRWWTGGRRVGFVHFSGFDVESPDVLSRHQDRLALRERPELVDLFGTYRSLLLDAGFRRHSATPNAYSCFAGTKIPVPDLARRLLQRLDPHARRWSDPFVVRGPDTFLAWLVEDVVGAGGHLNRAVLALWEERPDLVRAFPDVLGRDLPRYGTWLGEGGAAQAGLHPFFWLSLTATQDASRPAGPRFGYQFHPYHAAVVDHASEMLASVDLTAPGQLAEWLNDPIPGTARRSPTLTRLVLLLYRTRADIQSAFPDPLGRDQGGLADWFLRHAPIEYHLHPCLLRPVARGLPARARLRAVVQRLGLLDEANALEREAAPVEPTLDVDLPLGLVRSSPPAGVNLVGYFDHPTGVGRIAVGTRSALRHLGVPICTFAVDRSVDGRVLRGLVHPEEGVPHPLTVLHVNADESSRVLDLLPSSLRTATKLVGYWFWELGYFPLSLSDRFAQLDEVWVPTRFCQAAIEAVATIPVRLVPPCVLPPRRNEGLSRAAFELEPDRFYFFFAFDLDSVFERKNPLALVEAFRLVARRAKRPVGLAIKVSGSRRNPTALGLLQREVEGLAVKLVARELSRQQMDDLLGSCDAVVSLHRSEGLGLLPIEALFLDKPVIATAFGGVCDYLDDETGYPVPYSLVRLQEDHHPYPRGAVWAEPSVSEAAERMLHVLENPDEARARAARGRQRVNALYGPGVAAPRLEREIQRLLGPREPEQQALSIGALGQA